MTRRSLLTLAVLAAFAVGTYRVHLQRRAAVEAAQVDGAHALDQAATAPRLFFGRRLEPNDPVILHGAGQSDEASFAAYSVAVAPARPLLMMRYVDLHDNLPTFFAGLRHDLALHKDLLIPQIGLSLNAGSAEKHYEAEVAAGKDDAEIAQLCTGLNSLDRPAFLRVGYEFNGSWNGYQPASYVAAFRRIASAVHACTTGRVALVWDWSPDAELDAEQGGASPLAAEERWSPYYPGDDFVDWWGLNLFRPATITFQATRDFLDAAREHRFPVMIAESSPRGVPTTEGQAAVDQWFAPYFGLLRSSPVIKAFCYIDWDWRKFPQWADWGDARIEDDPTVLRFYRSQVVGNRLFAGARDRPATLNLLRSY